MKKEYTFDYNSMEAEAIFEVDTEVFTDEHARATLEFFTWDYDEEADPIDEVMKKYAVEAIKFATAENYNEQGVISEFDSYEGFCKIDGSAGIELISVTAYRFDPDVLYMHVVDMDDLEDADQEEQQ
jgi:hypothetical protein